MIKIQMTEIATQNFLLLIQNLQFWTLENLNFGFVSDFVLQISDL